jgi:hypothetical protein
MPKTVGYGVPKIKSRKPRKGTTTTTTVKVKNPRSKMRPMSK